MKKIWLFFVMTMIVTVFVCIAGLTHAERQAYIDTMGTLVIKDVEVKDIAYVPGVPKKLWENAGDTERAEIGRKLAPVFFKAATVIPPGGNISNFPVWGVSRTPAVSGNMVISIPIRPVIRRSSRMSDGSTQPGMRFKVRSRFALGSAR